MVGSSFANFAINSLTFIEYFRRLPAAAGHQVSAVFGMTHHAFFLDLVVAELFRNSGFKGRVVKQLAE